MMNPEVTPESRVSQSPLTKHWIVDRGGALEQGYREYDDALAEAEVRQAADIRRWADLMAGRYERQAVDRASDPTMLSTPMGYALALERAAL